MNWEELEKRVNEMSTVDFRAIIDNPAEVNLLINEWNSLIEYKPKLNSKQMAIYYILKAARKIALIDTNNKIIEIKNIILK